MKNQKLNFFILCGGSGSRLWPKSREKLPKQFLVLTGKNTMLQDTILRVLKVVKALNIESEFHLYIICNKDHYFIVEKQIETLNIELDLDLDLHLKLNEHITIVTEPKGRDSAPAICIASLLGKEYEKSFIMPCDHIFDDNHFVDCSLKSIPYLEDSILTFGIKPNKIETGYGYIKVGVNNKTENFVEKPNYENAKIYFECGDYLWNAGIFIFKNKNMINLFEKYSNDILLNCKETIKNSKLDSNIIHLNSDPFTNCRAISVDYAIMEYIVKDKDLLNINALTIEYNSYWNDIGSFSSLYDQIIFDETKNKIEKDNTDNNVLIGNIININTKNSYIESEKALTSVIGLDNLIIINSRDALLVCNKDYSQDVKKVVEKLKAEQREEAFYHSTVYRPWGYYTNIEGHDYNGFKVKRIAVYPGKRLSLQSHNKRSEHWVIVKGTGRVQVGEKFIILEKDQHVYIPIKTLHRIENIGSELLEFTETQIGEYLGEDDIIRYEDDFGRI